jgi:signal transduction histidine kinase
MNDNDIIKNLIHNLLNVDILDYQGIIENICKTLRNTIDNIIFTSFLLYNKETEQLIYTCIDYDIDLYDKEKLADKLKDNIELKVNDSMSGQLISSDPNEKIWIVDDVLKIDKYKSLNLAKILKLKKCVVFRIDDLRTKEIYGILLIYPGKKCPIHKLKRVDLKTILAIIEIILSNSKRTKENIILSKIADEGKKVKKDLSSFLHNCIRIIKQEIYAKGCSIFILDPRDELIKVKAHLGMRPGPALKNPPERFTKLDIYYSLGEGITGSVVKNNKPFITHQLDTTLSKWLDNDMSSTFLVVPIPNVDNTKAIGAIRCATKSNKLIGSMVESFNHEDKELLEYIAKLISTFIEIYNYQENQNQLLTKMPHEVRASLHNIMSICDYLQMNLFSQTINNDQIYQKLEDIIDECNLSVITVNSPSMLEEEIEAYYFEYIDIFTDIIAKVRKMLNPFAITDKNVKIVYDNEIKLPKIYCDKNRIQIVFHNLLLNALKYSYKSKRKYPPENIKIKSNIRKNGNGYTIEISNIGIPIPFSRKEDIFNFGVRLLEAIEVAPNGKGMGLTLVRKVLELHKCSIEVTNLYNPTTFTIFIPNEIVLR